jgi:hypothetical protein
MNGMVVGSLNDFPVSTVMKQELHESQRLRYIFHLIAYNVTLLVSIDPLGGGDEYHH